MAPLRGVGGMLKQYVETDSEAREQSIEKDTENEGFASVSNSRSLQAV
jgi:hypothetical protein